MDLEDFLGPNPKERVIDLRAEDRWEAIDELIAHLVSVQRIKAENRDAITMSVRNCESAMSTGIGFEIGLPHASTEVISEVIIAVGRSKKGIRFDALDGKPVRLVILFLAPQGQLEMHRHTLSKIAKLVHCDDFLGGL